MIRRKRQEVVKLQKKIKYLIFAYWSSPFSYFEKYESLQVLSPLSEIDEMGKLNSSFIFTLHHFVCGCVIVRGCLCFTYVKTQ